MHRIDQLINKFDLVRKELPEIRYIGDPVLRTKTRNASLEQGKRVGNRLIKTLGRYRKLTGVGRGLAANQIGSGASAFVTYVDDLFKIYINPVILKRSPIVNYYRESCISSGILWADVKRSAAITLQWSDESGERHSQRFDGFMARLIQHEYDHLRGVLNIDRAEPGSIEFAGNVLKEKLRNKK